MVKKEVESSSENSDLVRVVEHHGDSPLVLITGSMTGGGGCCFSLSTVLARG